MKKMDVFLNTPFSSLSTKEQFEIRNSGWVSTYIFLISAEWQESKEG
jgi:hypothetical protein